MTSIVKEETSHSQGGCLENAGEPASFQHIRHYNLRAYERGHNRHHRFRFSCAGGIDHCPRWNPRHTIRPRDGLLPHTPGAHARGLAATRDRVDPADRLRRLRPVRRIDCESIRTGLRNRRACHADSASIRHADKIPGFDVDPTRCASTDSNHIPRTGDHSHIFINRYSLTDCIADFYTLTNSTSNVDLYPKCYELHYTNDHPDFHTDERTVTYSYTHPDLDGKTFEYTAPHSDAPADEYGNLYSDHHIHSLSHTLPNEHTGTDSYLHNNSNIHCQPVLHSHSNKNPAPNLNSDAYIHAASDNHQYFDADVNGNPDTESDADDHSHTGSFVHTHGVPDTDPNLHRQAE